MTTTSVGLEDLADRVRRRAEGDLDALDGCWAEEIIVWHSFDDREQRIAGDLRQAHSVAKLKAFHAAMPNFQRSVDVHVTDRTSSVIEITTWTGRVATTDVVGATGVEIGYKSVTIYTVRDGRVTRLDIFDDPAASRSTAEITAYGHLVRTSTSAGAGR